MWYRRHSTARFVHISRPAEYYYYYYDFLMQSVWWKQYAGLIIDTHCVLCPRASPHLFLYFSGRDELEVKPVNRCEKIYYKSFLLFSSSSTRNTIEFSVCLALYIIQLLKQPHRLSFQHLALDISTV